MTLRLRATIPTPRPQLSAAASDGAPGAGHALIGETALVTEASAVSAPLCDREALRPGNGMDGPAVLAQTDATTYLPPGWRARVDDHLNLILERRSA